jgi:hypothetical protein
VSGSSSDRSAWGAALQRGVELRAAGQELTARVKDVEVPVVFTPEPERAVVFGYPLLAALPRVRRHRRGPIAFVATAIGVLAAAGRLFRPRR